VRIEALYRQTTIVRTNITNVAIGTMVIIGEAGGSPYIATHFTLPSLLISLSLNVLLTLMIIIRLVLHSRDIRAILGTPLGGTSGLYKTIITMLIESCAIFAVSSVLVIGLLVTGNHALSTFMPVLTGTQVRAILRPYPSWKLFNKTTCFRSSPHCLSSNGSPARLH